MQAGMATRMPANTTTTPGSSGATPISKPMTESATIAPTMVTSPWAKLISSRMP